MSLQLNTRTDGKSKGHALAIAKIIGLSRFKKKTLTKPLQKKKKSSDVNTGWWIHKLTISPPDT